MGATQSVIETPLGRSIFKHIYKTTVPTSFNYSGHDKTYYLSTWDDNPRLSNPTMDCAHVKLPAGITFQVIDVEYINGFATPHISITIKFQSDVELNKIKDYIQVRSDINKLPAEFDNFIHNHFLTSYEHIPITQTNNIFIKSLFSDNGFLKLGKIKCKISGSHFFTYKRSNGINLDNPINHNGSLLNDITFE